MLLRALPAASARARARASSARDGLEIGTLLSKLPGGSRHHSQQRQQHQQQSDSYDHFWYNLTSKNVLYNYNALLTFFSVFITNGTSLRDVTGRAYLVVRNATFKLYI